MRKAVALDIDGVIVKGGQLISSAKNAVRKLCDHSIPFIFITNGGYYYYDY